jgi:hypothetical protein
MSLMMGACIKDFPKFPVHYALQLLVATLLSWPIVVAYGDGSLRNS